MLKFCTWHNPHAAGILLLKKKPVLFWFPKWLPDGSQTLLVVPSSQAAIVRPLLGREDGRSARKAEQRERKAASA